MSDKFDPDLTWNELEDAAEAEIARVREIANAALDLCLSINECHGCMDESRGDRAKYDRLRTALTDEGETE